MRSWPGISPSDGMWRSSSTPTRRWAGIAGTCNLNIRYGQMTMALIAQAAIAQLRKRLAPPATNWDARHMATAYFEGLEGDVRVDGDTIIVTYYNAPDADRLREHYEDLPAKLRAEKIDPRVPWLYGFMVDYRFR